MTTELKTAACYIRVSTDKQEELSPASQLKEIKKWAKDNNYILLSDYIFMENEGVSGRKADKRVEFQRMIATAKLKPKPFDAIIVWKFSRFARNQEESTFYKGLLRKKLGIDVISISEPVLEGMFGRLIEMIIEWFDEYYSVNLSGEVMRGMTEKAARGGYQSDIPYGYRANKTTGIPDVAEEEAAIVRLMFDMAADRTYSYSDICKRLNAMNVRTKRGNIWECRTIKYIISNPFYTGMVRWNRQHAESHSIKDPSEWIIAKGQHIPIITQEQYDTVQDVIRQRAATHIYNHKPVGAKHWLSSLIKCDSCGYSLFLGYKDRKTGMRSLQCGNYAKGKCSVSHSVTEKKLTAGLIAGLEDILQYADLSMYYSPLPDSPGADCSFIEEALAKLQQKEKRIKQAYRDGVDTLEEYKENKEIITQEKERLLEQLKTLKSKTHLQPRDIRAEICSVIDILNSDANDTVKGEAIRSIIDYATFIKSENRLDIHLKGFNIKG